MKIDASLRDPQLSLFEARPGDANVGWLEELLKTQGGWLTAREIMQHSFGRLNDRQVRSLANASDWIISGQRGYCHMEKGTLEDARHFCNSMESQINAMGKRVGRIRVNAHKIFG